MRLLTDEEIKINKKLCDEADILSEEEKIALKKRLQEINDEQCHGATWIT